MKSLILPEKPSVGKEIGRVLKCSSRLKSHWEGDRYVVTWALDYLPMLPERMKLSVIRRSRGQFNTIKSLFRRPDIDELIIATDAGREGELVARWIMRIGGWKGRVERLWISSQTDTAIKAGFAKLEDGNTSAGRVQTPVLNLIAGREKKIERFVPKPYWTVEGVFDSFTTSWQTEKGKNRLNTEEAADKIIAKISGKTGRITSVSTKKKSTPPPQAYDLTALQRDANSQLSFSAKKTLQVLQGLYERHKYVTYPRTDSRHITPDVAATLTGRFRALADTPFGGTAKSYLSKPPMPGKRFVDGSRVSDHHALIPTEEKVNLKNLDSDERSLWTLVVRRFLAVLAAPHTFESHEVLVEIEGERFTARGTSVVKAVKKQAFTQPPPRYTEGTLLAAMENPGKFIEDRELKASIASGGLGTPATRAEIIEKLISSYYVERRGKELHPTTRGIELLELVPEPLKSPVLTAQWERRLSKIAGGEEKPAAFSSGIRNSTVALVKEIKASTAKYSPKNTTGKSCPVCGKPLMTVRSKRGETLVCHALSCGYEEERTQDGGPGSRPSKRERDTARRYMRQYKTGSETTSFADLIRAAEERKKEDS